MSQYDLKLKVKRYDPETKKSWVQDYQLQTGGILRMVDVFRQVNDELDPTLAWSSSCEHGQCGSCGMKINGKPLLTCEHLVENLVQYFKTDTFTVEPLTVAPTIRDLVINMEEAYKKIYAIKPFILKHAPPPKDGKEYRITPVELEAYVDATRCINCFCCATACVTQGDYIGPNAMMAGIVKQMDPREADKEAREDILYGSKGSPRCRTAKACSHVCPKDIDIAHYIALLKEGKVK